MRTAFASLRTSLPQNTVNKIEPHLIIINHNKLSHTHSTPISLQNYKFTKTHTINKNIMNNIINKIINYKTNRPIIIFHAIYIDTHSY